MKPMLHSLQGQSTRGGETVMQVCFFIFIGAGQCGEQGEREVRMDTVSKDSVRASNPLSCILTSRWLAIRMRKVRGQELWVLRALSKVLGESRGLFRWTREQPWNVTRPMVGNEGMLSRSDCSTGWVGAEHLDIYFFMWTRSMSKIQAVRKGLQYCQFLV